MYSLFISANCFTCFGWYLHPSSGAHIIVSTVSGIIETVTARARLKRDGTCAETRFGLSAKRKSPLKLAGCSVQSTTGSRGMRISSSNGSNAGYTMFWGRVQDYWLPTPVACFPFTSPTVCYRVPSGFIWTLSVVSVTVTVTLTAGSNNLWLVPDTVDTVIWVPDGGWRYHPIHVSLTDINKLYIVVSCWTIIDSCYAMHGPLDIKTF